MSSLFTSLYEYSLQVLIVITLFTCVGYAIGGHLKDRPFVTDNYVHSRYWMSGAMLLLFVLALIHNGSNIRLYDNFAGATITICFMYVFNQLLAYADMSLTHPEKVTLKRVGIGTFISVIYIGIFGYSYHFLPYKTFQIITYVLAFLFYVQSIAMMIEYSHNYKRIISGLSNYFSVDYESYLRWMPQRSLLFGLIQMLSPIVFFLPLGAVTIFNLVISGVLFYAFVSYERYLFYDCYCNVAVHTVIAESAEAENTEENNMQAFNSDESIRVLIQRWVDDKLYCQKDITIVDLSRYVGTNRTYLSKFINSVYGISFRNWIAELRIEEAKRQLVDTNKPLSEVAIGLGFSSSSTFSRTFAQITGLTPTTYRKINKYKIEAI